MNKFYNYSFIVYRTILLAMTPLFLVASFLVGAGGHNPSLRTQEYFIFGFTILTPLLMFVYTSSNSYKNAIRIGIMILIAISILFFVYTLYDFWIFFQNNENQSGDEIPVFIVSVLTVLSSIIFYGLLQNKIQTRSK